MEKVNSCQYCSSTFKNATTLKTHLITSKKCLRERGLSIDSNFKCNGCNHIFMTKLNITVHQKSCTDFIVLQAVEAYKKENNELIQKNEHNMLYVKELHEKLEKSEKIISEQNRKLSNNENSIVELERIIFNHENTIKELQTTLEKIKIEQDNYLTLKVRYEELEKVKIEQDNCLTLKGRYEELEKQKFLIEKQYEKTITKLEQKIAQSDKVFQDIILNRIYNESDIELDESLEDNNINDDQFEYKLQPLDLGNDMYIESREDGYINITNLYKAGDKLFDHWNSLEKTKAYLKALSSDIAITIPALITHQTGSGSEQKTWVHPYVAINIAQWISPEFDAKILSWIYEVMLTGKIDISKTKSFQQLRLENKEQKIKIQYLTKKYVKSQPRIQYTEQNVIYILTTPSHKKEGKYILGKATNLTNRLSVYNKTDEHEVVYYQSCGDEETMSIVEQFVFQRLKDYREQANRERFILPEGKTIDLFIDVIKKTIG
jgi:hypothetical protein